MSIAAIGVGVGVAVAFVLTRFMHRVIFDVHPANPLTFVAIALFLGATALMAGMVPARRAVRIDPVVSLQFK